METTAGRAHEFETTKWGVVVTAMDPSSPAALDSLNALCRCYWYPLYAYLRRKGHSKHDAEDLLQNFFCRLIEKSYLKTVRREKGRFRSFLLAALKHFEANEWDKTMTIKRGGRITHIALDGLQPEERYRLEPVDQISPERLSERRWALTVLDQARERLRHEYAKANKANFFDVLWPVAYGERRRTYLELAKELRTTEELVKTKMYRMKQRYGEKVREVVAETVANRSEVDEEIRYLISVVDDY